MESRPQAMQQRAARKTRNARRKTFQGLLEITGFVEGLASILVELRSFVAAASGIFVCVRRLGEAAVLPQQLAQRVMQPFGGRAVFEPVPAGRDGRIETPLPLLDCRQQFPSRCMTRCQSRDSSCATAGITEFFDVQ